MNVKIYEIKKQDETSIKVDLEDIKKGNFLVLEDQLSDGLIEIFEKLEGIVDWETFKNFLLSNINQFKLENFLKKLEEFLKEDQLILGEILVSSDQHDFINLPKRKLNLDNNLAIEVKLIEHNSNELFINLNLLNGLRISKSWSKRIKLQEVKEGEKYKLYSLSSKDKNINEGYSKIQEINNFNILEVSDERLNKKFKGLEDIEDTKSIEIDEKKSVNEVDGEKQDSQVEMTEDQLKERNSWLKERRTELKNLETGSKNTEASQEESKIKIEESFINNDQSISKLGELIEVLSSSLEDNTDKVDRLLQTAEAMLWSYKMRQHWFIILMSFARSIIISLLYCLVVLAVIIYYNLFFYSPETIDPWLAKLNAKFRSLGWKWRSPRVKRRWSRNDRIIIWFERT